MLSVGILSKLIVRWSWMKSGNGWWEMARSWRRRREKVAKVEYLKNARERRDKHWKVPWRKLPSRVLPCKDKRQSETLFLFGKQVTQSVQTR